MDYANVTTSNHLWILCTHTYTNDMAVDEHVDYQTGGPMLLWSWGSLLTLGKGVAPVGTWLIWDIFFLCSLGCLSVFQLEMTSWFSR